MEANLRRLCRAFPLVLGLAALAGCEAPKPAEAASAPVVQDISRDAAIQNARRDAAFRYAEVQVARVDARRLGGFWVVELSAMAGPNLRYTISALDGTIRERNMFQ